MQRINSLNNITSSNTQNRTLERSQSSPALLNNSAYLPRFNPRDPTNMIIRGHVVNVPLLRRNLNLNVDSQHVDGLINLLEQGRLSLVREQLLTLIEHNENTEYKILKNVFRRIE